MNFVFKALTFRLESFDYMDVQNLHFLFSFNSIFSSSRLFLFINNSIPNFYIQRNIHFHTIFSIIIEKLKLPIKIDLTCEIIQLNAINHFLIAYRWLIK